MPANPERILANARQASTEDLLNRVTVFRGGMEPEAVFVIEQELRSRGVTASDIRAHGDRLADEVIMLEAGFAAGCSFCTAPAVAEGWGWHRLLGRLPVFPRYYYYCKEHVPEEVEAAPAEETDPDADGEPDESAGYSRS